MCDWYILILHLLSQTILLIHEVGFSDVCIVKLEMQISLLLLLVILLSFLGFQCNCQIFIKMIQEISKVDNTLYLFAAALHF